MPASGVVVQRIIRKDVGTKGLVKLNSFCGKFLVLRSSASDAVSKLDFLTAVLIIK